MVLLELLLWFNFWLFFSFSLYSIVQWTLIFIIFSGDVFPNRTLLIESVVLIIHVLSKVFSFFCKIYEGRVISLIPINEFFLMTLIEYLASFFGIWNLWEILFLDEYDISCSNSRDSELIIKEKLVKLKSEGK